MKTLLVTIALLFATPSAALAQCEENNQFSHNVICAAIGAEPKVEPCSG